MINARFYDKKISKNTVKIKDSQSNMVAREITIVKKPRETPIQDVPISFPPLQNLHLDLMENKKKLKKNIPLIQIKKDVKPQEATAVKYTPEMISGAVGAVAGGVAAVLSEKSTKKEGFKKISVENKEKKKIEEPDEEEPADADEGEPNEPDEPDVEDPEDDLRDLKEDDDELKEIEDEPEPDEPKEPEPADEPEEKAEEAVDDDPYAGMSPEEREFAEKEEFIWRFKILKKQYKTRNIQDYNEHDDLKSMKQTYNRTLREIQLEDNCESYRTYLVGGFMLMEFVSNNWMGVDLTGFTAQQMTMMSRYDRMLIELGEKSYNRWGSNLPVEVRLIGFIILQAGIFYLGKIIAQKGGGSMVEIFKMFTGAPAAPVVENKGLDTGEPKKKMRGPSVKVEDLKKKIVEESEN